MRELTPTHEKAMALEWIVQQMLSDRFSKEPDPAAAARDFAEMADKHWSDMAMVAISKPSDDLFATINAVGAEIETILQQVVEDLSSDSDAD